LVFNFAFIFLLVSLSFSFFGVSEVALAAWANKGRAGGLNLRAQSWAAGLLGGNEEERGALFEKRGERRGARAAYCSLASMEIRGEATTDVHLSGDKGIEDMIKMNNLDEESILKNLKIRYLNNLIYVRVLQ
jgi:myosin heavy subunit